MQRFIGTWVIALIGLAFVSFASPAIAQQPIEATLAFDRTEFELGEPIVFAYGRKVRGMIDAIRFQEPLCELSVRRPDGTKVFTREIQGFAIYDGPSQVNSLFRRALLNDLARLSEGNYHVVHSCGARGVSQQIVIKPPSLFEKVSIAVVLPQAVDLSGSNPLSVIFTVRNGLNRPVRIVAPGPNRYAGVVAALSVPTIPAGGPLPTRSFETVGSAVPVLLPAAQPNIAGLSVVNLAPGESFTANVTLTYGVDQRSLTRGEAFELHLAAIVPVLLEGDQPVIRAYRKTGACYDRSGTRIDEECTLSYQDWVLWLPYDLPRH
jgi:hypothetical protein